MRTTARTGPSAEGVERIRRLLLAAYDGGRRDLPWRGEKDPYRILVSEVMLQQTRVETVVPFYRRWMERFPRLELLADASEDEVLRIWEGLGYYGRARRLLRTARIVRERYGASLPTKAAELRTLPGIGPYTAGAVASIAFGEPVPAVDGNVRRVISRLFDIGGESTAEVEALAAAVLDPARPGDFNQAMMELGARVCTPRAPSCEVCPLRPECRALQAGTVLDRPARRRRPRVRQESFAVSVLVRAEGEGCGGRPKEPLGAGARLLLRRREGDGLLAGMWELPTVRLGVEEEVAAALDSLHREMGWDASGVPFRELESVLHAFSHLRARYRPFLYFLPVCFEARAGRWVSAAETEELPISVAHRKILEGVWAVLGVPLD